MFIEHRHEYCKEPQGHSERATSNASWLRPERGQYKKYEGVKVEKSPLGKVYNLRNKWQNKDDDDQKQNEVDINYLQ